MQSVLGLQELCGSNSGFLKVVSILARIMVNFLGMIEYISYRNNAEDVRILYSLMMQAN